ADAPLTPGTCDQERAIPPCRELLTTFWVLCPEIERRVDPRVSRLQHISTPSCAKVCDRAKTLNKATAGCDLSSKTRAAEVFRRKGVYRRNKITLEPILCSR